MSTRTIAIAALLIGLVLILLLWVIPACQAEDAEDGEVGMPTAALWR